MKVALLGAGQRGVVYAKALKEMKNMELVAVVDLFENTARALAQECGFKSVYTDYREMLKKEKPDAVIVCTSAQTHGDIALAAFEIGAHVFSEKPIELSMVKAAGMIDAAKAKKLNFGIGLQYRCRSTYRSIKRAIESGIISTPMVIRFTDFRQVRPRIAYHNVYENGGPIMDTICHSVDLMGWYYESVPEAVDAYGFTMAAHRPELASIEHKATDTGMIHLQFKSGDIGCLDVCWGLPKDVEDYFKFDGVCAKGRIEVRRTDPNPYTEAQVYIHTGNKEEKLVVLNEKDQQETAFAEKTMLVEFFDEIAKGAYSYKTAEAAYSTLAVSLAALKSIHEKRRVTVDEIYKEKPEADKYMV
ncbi:MAG: Gfo/Idh/MocA family protein [Christensenellales bacterium]